MAEVEHCVQRSSRLFERRALALFWVLVLVIAGLAAELHKHDATQEATCIVCHAADPATLVVVALDAGHVNLPRQEVLPVPKAIVFTSRHIGAASPPRAPPATLAA